MARAAGAAVGGARASARVPPARGSLARVVVAWLPARTAAAASRSAGTRARAIARPGAAAVGGVVGVLSLAAIVATTPAPAVIAALALTATAIVVAGEAGTRARAR